MSGEGNSTMLEDLREAYVAGHLTVAQLEEATWNFLNGYWPGPLGCGVKPPAPPSDPSNRSA